MASIFCRFLQHSIHIVPSSLHWIIWSKLQRIFSNEHSKSVQGNAKGGLFQQPSFLEMDLQRHSSFHDFVLAAHESLPIWNGLGKWKDRRLLRTWKYSVFLCDSYSVSQSWYGNKCMELDHSSFNLGIHCFMVCVSYIDQFLLAYPTILCRHDGYDRDAN